MQKVLTTTQYICVDKCRGYGQRYEMTRFATQHYFAIKICWYQTVYNVEQFAVKHVYIQHTETLGFFLLELGLYDACNRNTLFVTSYKWKF